MANPRILIVEDDVPTSMVTRKALEASGYTVVAELASIEAAGTFLDTHPPPDLVLLDIDLGGDSGIVLGARLDRDRLPFVYLTGLSDEATLRRAAATGPGGFVVKPCSKPQLLSTITMALEAGARREARTETAMHRIAAILVEQGLVSPVQGRVPVETPALAQLSAREWDVVRALLAHNRVPAIATKLAISPSTVRNHLKSIFAKLGVHSQQELLTKVTAER